jgi:hypothetical protein
VTTRSELELGSLSSVIFFVGGWGHAVLLLHGTDRPRDVADVVSAGFDLGETAAEGRVAILSMDALPMPLSRPSRGRHPPPLGLPCHALKTGSWELLK